MTITIDKVRVVCPYCNTESMEPADRYSWQTVECDESEGGCGKLFIYKTELNVRTIVRRVEGEAS